MTNPDERLSGYALLLEREVQGEATAAWSALTDAAELAAWFWPPSADAQVGPDLTVGAGWSLTSAPWRMAVRGQVVESSAPTADGPGVLRATWSWDGEEAVSEFELTLTPRNGGSLLRLKHTGFPDEQARDDHIQGWHDCLDRLDPHLAGTLPPAGTAVVE